MRRNDVFMNIFRNNKVVRPVSIVLLVSVGISLAPTDALALTSGNQQPEYTKYAEPGRSEMVNLQTGDFTYDLPILEIPGPEGSFSLPLSYDAGVGLEQESSWVGLGWSMNAGSVTRVVNEYPDDASGENHTVVVKDLDVIKGVDTRIFGVGHVGWNSQIGNYGSLSLLGVVNADWGHTNYSIGVLGINMTNHGVKPNPVQMGIGIMTLISWGSAHASGTAAAASQKGATAESIAAGGKTALMKEVVKGAKQSLLRDVLFGSNMMHKPSTSGYYPWSVDSRNHFWGFFNHRKYKTWLSYSRNEKMYGILYLGNAGTQPYTPEANMSNLKFQYKGVDQTVNEYYNPGAFSPSRGEGATMDLTFQLSQLGTFGDFHSTNAPALNAPDQYSVYAPGIGGKITPYRLDFGTLAMPRPMGKTHKRMAPVQYMPNDATNKVPFIYDGQTSNSYWHHAGGTSSVSSTSGFLGVEAAYQVSGNTNTVNFTDHIFQNERIRSDINTQKKFGQSNYVEWMSNAELLTTMVNSSGFMEYFSGGTGTTVQVGSDRYVFRSSRPIGFFRSYTSSAAMSTNIPIKDSEISKFAQNDLVDISITTLDASGNTIGIDDITGLVVNSVTVSTANNSKIVITDSRLNPFLGLSVNLEIKSAVRPPLSNGMGGFVITGADGTSYHFAFPVYDFDEYNYIRDVIHTETKRTITKKTSPFAHTWLLTGITGSDFIDRNQNGLIDDADWGKWIKMNYGVHMDDYLWRTPYAGFQKFPGDTHEGYSEGKKQLVYLNSIETRSHVALFFKSQKNDGKSANTVVSQFPLKLDEIVLVNKETYKRIVKPVGQGGFGIAPLSNSWQTILKSADITADMRKYLNHNCSKRIVFDHRYLLCKGTVNSVDVNQGKLTLHRLSIYGRGNIKIVPDYLFEYGNNPDYNVNHFDLYGMYNPAGTSSSNGHDVSSSSTEASAWSLTRITSPLGGVLDITYERDDYYAVSGNTFTVNTTTFVTNSNYNIAYPVNFPVTKATISNSSLYAVGDSVQVEGTLNYYLSTNPSNTLTKSFLYAGRVQGIGSNFLELGVDFMGLNGVLTQSGTFIHVNTQDIKVWKPYKNQKGGDIRVSAVSLSDEFGNVMKLRYLYKNNDGTSSGVISQSLRSSEWYPFYEQIGYPQTPVIYKTVSVLSGNFTSDANFSAKTVYDFIPPDRSLYTMTQSVISDNIKFHSFADEYLSIYHHKFEDRTSQIGKLKSVKSYNESNQLRSSSTYTYTEQIPNNSGISNQGLYSQGALMYDIVEKPNTLTYYHKINRTYARQYPSVLKSVVTTNDGFKNEVQNLSWDFYTGRVLSKIISNGVGLTVKSVVKPAYLVYPEMGCKGISVANKNMLIQDVATYTFLSDVNGYEAGLLDASVQLWSKNWDKYRVYNSANQTFSDASEDVGIWRKGAAYQFVGSPDRLKPDGSLKYSAADDYNFATVNPLWRFSEEVTRYDHYSMSLESKSDKNVFTSIKMGYDNQKMIASAMNAEYSEIAFSGAEDLQTDKPFFGGEVGLGGGMVLSASKNQITLANTGDAQITEPHTGDAIVTIPSGAKSFIYKVSTMNNSSYLKPNKRYRVSVWTNSLNTRIYYNLNLSGEQISSAPSASSKAGKWYLLTHEFTTGASFNSIEIGVKSQSGTVVVDDFRFQPIDAAVKSYVSPPNNFEFPYNPEPTSTTYYEYILDNDNLATKYEYNERGFLVKIYKEALSSVANQSGFKLIYENTEDYRRFNYNP